MNVKTLFKDTSSVNQELLDVAQGLIRPHLDFSDPDRASEFLFCTASIEIADNIVNEFTGLKKGDRDKLRNAIDDVFGVVWEEERKLYDSIAGLTCPRHQVNSRALNAVIRDLGEKADAMSAGFAKDAVSLHVR